MILVLIFQILIFPFFLSISEIATLILSMSLTFIKAWSNDKWYVNKTVLIWRFTLVLIKKNYGQIGEQTGLFYTTNPVFYTSGNRFVRCTVTFGNLIFWFQVVPARSRFDPSRFGPKLKVDSAPFEIKYFWTEIHKWLSFQNVFDRFWY